MKRPPRCDPARLPSVGAFSSARRLATPRRAAIRDLALWLRACSVHTVLPPWDRARHPFKPARFHPAFSGRWWLPALGSRSRLAFFLTQDASLNLSAAYRLLQRVFNYDARTHFCELDPRPPQGTALRALPLVVAPFGAARSLLLDGRDRVPDVPQRATRFSPTSGLETQTPPAETGAPSDDAF